MTTPTTPPATPSHALPQTPDDHAHSVPNERRRSPRAMFVRPCKLRAAGRTTYTPAETSDWSAGGALIRVARNHLLAVDDWIELSVAWDRQPLLSGDQALKARVRRVVPIDHHHQAIGVQFHAAADARLAAAA